MMTPGTLRYKIYILPFIIGGCLGIGIYFAIQESGLLATSIGGAPVHAPVLYDVALSIDEHQQVTLTTAKEISDITTMSLIISFDPERVNLEHTDISSPYQINSSLATPGQYVVILQNIGTITADSPLLRIIPTGESDLLTISDVLVSFEDGSSAPLAVGF